jgi:hypothetical protein
MEDKFSAKEQMLGYFYQPLYALYKLMQIDIADEPDSFIIIENLDDIEFRSNIDALKLIQTKHHIKSQGSISDRSSDLWKTIRIWTERIVNDEVKLDNVIFSLVTTSTAFENSIASKLRVENRNTQEALSTIQKIAEEGYINAQKRQNNPELKKHENEDAYIAFYKLDKNTQKKFISKIYICDSSSTIEYIVSNIEKKLQYACNSSDRKYFAEKLTGWWIIRVITSLLDKKQEQITKFELDDKIEEFKEEFKRGSLPIDYENEFNDISEDNLTHNEKIFIEQLKTIKVTPKTISDAICDYYRAYNQRGLWVRKSKILNSHLEEYDTRLTNEWSREFENMISNIDENCPENVQEKQGRDLYNTIGNKTLPICEAENHKIKGHYIMRGSFHMLANKVRIGWHPNYKDKMEDYQKSLLAENIEVI